MTCFLYYEDLERRGIVRSRTTLYRKMKNGEFPSGMRMGAYRVWTEDEIKEHVKKLQREAA